METKYIIRIGGLLTAALVFSIISVYRGSSGAYINDNKLTANKNIPPYISIFHNVGGFFNAELHGRSQQAVNDALAATSHATSSVTSSVNVGIKDTVNNTRIPAEIISGVINDESIWNVKIGPFRDASYVQELTRYLLANGFKVLLKADISEAGYDFTVFLNPTTNRSVAEQTITNLNSKYHIAAVITKNYS